MEIRNSTPTFGMAFRIDYAEGFAKYVYKDTDPKTLARRREGVMELIRRHHSDLYNDVVYNYESNNKIPHRVFVKEKVKSGRGFVQEYTNSNYLNHKERTLLAYDKATEKSQNALNIFLRKTFRPLVEIKENIYMQMHPIESLPASLREASDFIAKTERLSR